MEVGDVFTAAQAVAAGSTYRWLSAVVAQQRYERPFRGIYLRLNSTWKDRLVAAGVAAGDAVVSHRAAARLHGLWGLEKVDLIELTIPPRRRFSRRGMVIHHSPLEEYDVTEVDGLSGVTTLVRTVIDLAGILEGRALAIAFESAWCKDRNLLDGLEERLKDIGNGRHGVASLRRLIAEARRRKRPLESPLEVKLWRQLKSWGLPAPLTGVLVDDGGDQRYQLDFIYDDQRLAIETDGWNFHRTREQWSNDCLKQTRAAAAGYRVMRVTEEDVEQESALKERIFAALGLRELRPKLAWGTKVGWPKVA